MSRRGIQIFSNLARGLPEVKKAQRKIPLSEKFFWTGLVVIIYLIMAQVPLYGVNIGKGDPFALLRVIFASQRGTLMELGIGPIVTAGLVMQLLVGAKIINLDLAKPSDRAIFTSANKLFAIVMTGFEAVAYIAGGMYGKVTPNIGAIIFGQLLVAGIMVILLDEMLQKGWGLGSGISLFIAAGVAQRIFWDCFDPFPAKDGYFYGALLAFGQSIAKGQIGAIFFRGQNLPTMIGFFSMLVIFAIIIYLEGVKVNIPISHAKFRGFRASYPVKFFYVSNIPVILASSLFADVYFGANILSSKFPNNPLTKFLGVVDPTTGNPTGASLIYYLTPPRNLSLLANDPLRAVIYTLIMVGICVAFSITWIEVAGLGSKSVAKQLISSGMQIPGFRRAEGPIQDVLDRYIPVVAVLGGLSIGLIASIADFFSSFGTGTGILLTTSIMWQYYQILAKEQVEEMYPGLGKLLGT